MNEIEKLAQDADFIVNGYAFFCNEATVRVLNLNDPLPSNCNQPRMSSDFHKYGRR